MSTEVNIQPVSCSNNQTVLSFSDAAIKQIKRHLEKHPNYISVRFSTKIAGCSGMRYVVEFIDQKSLQDEAIVIDTDLTVYVDKKSISFIKGTHVDYVWKMAKFSHEWEFSNPNVKASCGCGESFTTK